MVDIARYMLGGPRAGLWQPSDQFSFFPVTLSPYKQASRAMDCTSADLRAFLQGIGLQDGLELTEYYNTADTIAAAVPVHFFNHETWAIWIMEQLRRPRLIEARAKAALQSV